MRNKNYYINLNEREYLDVLQGMDYEINEGNSGDSVRINQYSVGHYEILGYGVPQY